MSGTEKTLSSPEPDTEDHVACDSPKGQIHGDGRTAEWQLSGLGGGEVTTNGRGVLWGR